MRVGRATGALWLSCRGRRPPSASWAGSRPRTHRPTGGVLTEKWSFRYDKEQALGICPSRHRGRSIHPDACRSNYARTLKLCQGTMARKSLLLQRDGRRRRPSPRLAPRGSRHVSALWCLPAALRTIVLVSNGRAAPGLQERHRLSSPRARVTKGGGGA